MAMWSFFLTLICCLATIHGCGISTHIEVTERTREYLGINSEGIDFKELVDKHQDAYQAGASYPDAFYPDFCFGGDFHSVAEDTHWTPFILASVDYIRKNYPKPWSEETEKLIVFLLAIVQHQVADVSWHSLGIQEGFLRAMAAINYHGQFNPAHSDGDFGGDVVNIFGLDMDYIGRLDRWYVPTQDLLGIYEELYGTVDRMREDVINNCTFLLFLGRLGENIGVIDLLYPAYASRSPFLIDQLQSYYLGGMDDMATWSAHVMGHTVTMLDHGTDVCYTPNNPIYIECNEISDRGLTHRSRRKSKNSYDEFSSGIDEEFLKKTSSLVNKDDIDIYHSDRGVYFEATKPQNKIQTSATIDDEPDYTFADATYTISHAYSRFGEALLVGDVNNDGLDDLIIGAPDYSEIGKQQLGAVFIVYGSQNGFPSLNSSIEDIADQTFIGEQDYGRYGNALALVDLNADGFNDLAVSAPTVGSEILEYHGAVYVYFGSSSGPEDTPSIEYLCDERYCNFGSALTSGDLNSDGYADLVVGSPFSPGGNGEQRGTVSVLFSDPSRSNNIARRHRQQIISKQADSEWIYAGSQNYDWTGFSLDVHTTSSGDAWLAIGAPTHRICVNPDCSFNTNDPQSVGQVLLFRAPLSNTPDEIIRGEQIFGQLGFAVKFGKQFDEDVLAFSAVTAVGELSAADNMTQAGQVLVHSISSDGINVEPLMKLDGDRSFGRFGSSIQFFNVDGEERIVVGANLRSHSMLQDREGGKVFIFRSERGSHQHASNAEAILSSGEGKSRFGSDLAISQSQLIASAPFSNIDGRISGRVLVFNI